MNRTALTTAAATLAIPAMLLMTGCPRGSSAVKELAEDAMVEALVTQSISSYNSVAISASVNNLSIDMACSTGGTVSWEDLESADEICYQVDSRGCEFVTGNERSFSIQGTSTMCGSDSFAVTEDARLATGQTFRLSGDATVSNDDGSRTCSYDFDVIVDSVLGDGAEYSISVDGTLCGRRDYSGSFDISLSGEVTVSE